MENNDVFIRELDPGIGQAVAARTILRKLDPVSKQQLHALAKGEVDSRPSISETWGDVAARVAKGNSLLDPDTNRQVQEEQALFKHIAKANLLMSGRHLQHGDETQPNRPFTVFSNCSTAPMSFLSFYLLLNGSGVGRCFDDEFMLVDWSDMPKILCVIDSMHPDVLSGEINCPSPKEATLLCAYTHTEVFKVPDSREGWAQAVEKMENLAFLRQSDVTLVLDFSDVRCKGTPIGGMQDRPASGPGPLIGAIENITRLKGAKLPAWLGNMYVDHYLSECVLVGGARRAARISVKHWKQPGILTYAGVKKHHALWSANNSIAVDKEFWDTCQTEGTWAHTVFTALTTNVYYDDNGEPGTVNVDKLHWVDIEHKPSLGDERMPVSLTSHSMFDTMWDRFCRHGYKAIVNPCVTGYTPVLTNEGFKSASSLAGSAGFTAVVGGKTYKASGFKMTGINHQTYEVLDSLHRTILTATADHRVLAMFSTPDGLDYFYRWTRLTELKKGDLLLCLEDHMSVEPIDGTDVSVNISSTKYADPSDFTCVQVEEINTAGVKPVYDCSVEEVHCYQTSDGVGVHNCGEISISMLGGFCIIADSVPFHADSLDEAEDAVRVATRALIRVNTLPSIYTSEVKRTNRIGVALTGIHEFAWKFFGFGWRDLIDENKSQAFWDALARLKAAVSDEAESYSKALGMTTPHTNTCIKPSGSVSKLFNLTEGAHLPGRRAFLRWVQFRNDDPLVEKYKQAGYPTRELTTYKGTIIVGFPTKPLIASLGMGDKLVIAPEASPEEQYQYLRLLEKYWIGEEAGNNVSYTLKFDPKDISFEAFQKTLFDGQSSIKCCSVLPVGDTSAYEYLPEENVTEHEYDVILQAIQKADSLTEDVDFAHVDCSTGACPVDFKRKDD